MITGHSIYDDTVSELMDRLKAKGVLLIVIDGEKNKAPIEFASAMTEETLPHIIECLDRVSLMLQADLLEIRRKDA